MPYMNECLGLKVTVNEDSPLIMHLAPNDNGVMSIICGFRSENPQEISLHCGGYVAKKDANMHIDWLNSTLKEDASIKIEFVRVPLNTATQPSAIRQVNTKLERQKKFEYYLALKKEFEQGD
jgi:hypothetical protein